MTKLDILFFFKENKDTKKIIILTHKNLIARFARNDHII